MENKSLWQEELGKGTSPKGLGLREQNWSLTHSGLLPKQAQSELTQKEPPDKKPEGAVWLVVFKLSFKKQ